MVAKKYNFSILVDQQEKLPYTFGTGITTEVTYLKTGDYTLKDYPEEIIIERKSLDDYVKTIITEKERFFKELERAKTFQVFVIVVEGSIPEILAEKYTVPNITCTQVMGMTSYILLNYKVPILFCTDRQHAIYVTEKLLRDYYESKQQVQKDKNLSKETGLAKRVRTRGGDKNIF